MVAGDTMRDVTSRDVEPPRRLFLLDGHSLSYRAFFALPTTLATSTGQVTNAVYGFTSMLIKLLAEERPDLIAVAFTGEDHGQFEPCGCSEGMLGGLARRPARLAAFVEPGVPFVAVSGGGLVTGLYNQKEVWPLFGYEGESYSKGGYIDRGFDDIAWL